MNLNPLNTNYLKFIGFQDIKKRREIVPPV
jgi:hypothetical protein